VGDYGSEIGVGAGPWQISGIRGLERDVSKIIGRALPWDLTVAGVLEEEHAYMSYSSLCTDCKDFPYHTLPSRTGTCCRPAVKRLSYGVREAKE
jgi:hypothetical protein